MWVRSQDKRILIKSSKFKLIHAKGEIYTIVADGEYIGDYALERAIEVLGYIQHRIEEIANDTCGASVVCQMPEK